MDRVASLGGNPPYHVEVGDEDDTGNGFSRTVTTVATVALDTPCRVAITRTPAHLAIALNGAEIATDDTAFPVGSMSMNKFGIGGALNGGFPDFNDLVVTRFAIYAAQSDAATLALSAAS
jgi:hypothetical protein